MASLYTQQDSNIHRTWLLFAVFLVFVIGLGWVLSYALGNQAILYYAVIFSIGSSFVSYFFSDQIALGISRAEPIKKEDNPMLYNTVENLCIAAGLPTPRIYITPEMQINAFATGRNAKTAAIAVTAGALQKLDKTELEGVLAHELSHIGNRDILVSSMAVVLAGVISILANFFMRSLFFGGGRKNDRDGSAGIFIIVGIALSVLAPIGAMLLQMAISRRRESLADTSGALLTRFPDGLANALEKIKDDVVPMRTATDATAHLWIENPYHTRMNFMNKLFLSHPPIEERIKALREMSV